MWKTTTEKLFIKRKTLHLKNSSFQRHFFSLLLYFLERSGARKNAISLFKVLTILQFCSRFYIVFTARRNKEGTGVESNYWLHLFFIYQFAIEFLEEINFNNVFFVLI